jgi:hypothetical protein
MMRTGDHERLAATQREFAQALWHPQTPAATPFGRGMGVYQNNTRLTLLSVVETTYPVIDRVLGDAFFTALARSYVITTPSSSGNLFGYAQQFSGWLRQWLADLEDRDEAAELAYLPDLAQLEWLMHQAHFAPDAPPFDFAALQAVNPALQGALCFKLHPSCGLLCSDFPVAQIWRAHQGLDAVAVGELAAVPPSIDWEAVPERLLLWRQSLSQFEIAVKLQDCAAGAHQFLNDLALDQTFMQAASNALAIEATLDLQALLLDLVRDGVITGFELPKCA